MEPFLSMALTLSGYRLPGSGGAVGLVSQDIFLFSGTIHDNILFGVENGDGEGGQEAARVAQLLPAIESFSHQFQTVIGERGVRLSGGQKQRTALARAIIKNPPILILDDAFSSVDVETEEEILAGTETVHEGPDHFAHLPSHFHGAGRRYDRLPERRQDRRTGHA